MASARRAPRHRWGIAAAVCLLLATAAGAQRTPALPPISMTCPHHPDVIESKPGTCPFCKMALVPVRLAPAFTCPLHPATIADAAGTCPICRRQLVPVTVSITWTCKGSDAEFVEPGRCADGSARVERRALRPHGDHNPRHGGVFFMASDNWHHVEGVYPAPGVFRLYVYDDYARPLPIERLRRVQGRVVTRERWDAAARRMVEIESAPLRMAGDGAYLEARFKGVALPAEMAAKVQLEPGAAESRFDFTFVTTTREPAPAMLAPAAEPTAGTAARPRPAPAPARTETPSPRVSRPEPAGGGDAAPAPEPAPDAAALPAPDPALEILPIPDTVPAMLDQLRTRNGHVRGLIERGDFTSVWVPAFAAKDLALALEAHLDTLAPAARETAGPALERVVRFAWLLDAHGDSGNRQNLEQAYAAFDAAVRSVLESFGARP